MRGLTVVGGGHVGRVLGRLFSSAGAFAVRDVLARSADSAARAAAYIGSGAAAASYAALRPAEVYMLSVTDDQSVPACEALAAAVPLQGAVVFHCSGALASDRLQAARAAGAYARHPCLDRLRQPHQARGRLAPVRHLFGDDDVVGVHRHDVARPGVEAAARRFQRWLHRPPIWLAWALNYTVGRAFRHRRDRR